MSWVLVIGTVRFDLDFPMTLSDCSEQVHECEALAVESMESLEP